MVSRNRVFLTGSFFLFVIACAVSPSSPLTVEERLTLKHYSIGAEVKSIRNYRLNGWSSVNDRYIIVNTGVSDDYLIGFSNNCSATRSAMSIAFSSTAGGLTTSDKVLVSSSGNFIEHCFIRSITKIHKIKREPDK